MRPADVKLMFDGLTDPTKNILARKLTKQLSTALVALNADLIAGNAAEPLSIMTPPPGLILEAFRRCPIERARIVIIGQDPYINAGEAMGMSFSVPKGVKIPPSLKNIYKCLIEKKLMREMPTHGDLTSWADQGVLLINAALTTRLRKSNAHAEIWAAYTNAIIRELSNQPSLIFILFGGFAQEKAALISGHHVILQWGHPSNMNKVNTTPGPKNFINCNCFARANEHLQLRGQTPVCWDVDVARVNVEPRYQVQLNAPMIALEPVPQPAPEVVDARAPQPNVRAPTHDHIGSLISADAGPKCPADTVYVFTDGGSIANGKPKCVASYGWYVTDGQKTFSCSGIVPPVDLPDCEYKSSNQRGELTAILSALLYLEKTTLAHPNVVVVSDSEYSIKCITLWVDGWIAKNITDKKNMDLIVPAKESLDRLKKTAKITFLHCNSHQDEPAQDTDAWFIWKCNDIVDNLCTKALGR